jgi:hypothetical protein
VYRCCLVVIEKGASVYRCCLVVIEKGTIARVVG